MSTRTDAAVGPADSAPSSATDAAPADEHSADSLRTTAPGGGLRRTLRLEEQLTAAREVEAQVILTGAAVHDQFVDPDGRILNLPDELRSYAQRHMLALVHYRVGQVPVSLPTGAGDSAVSIGKIPADAHPHDAVAQLVSDIQSAQVPAVLHIDFADLIVGTDAHLSDLQVAALMETLQTLAFDREWRARGLTVVLTDRHGGLAARLTDQPGYHVIPVRPPDATECEIYLRRRQQSVRNTPLRLAEGVDPHRAGRLSGGLLLRDLAEIVSASSHSHPVTTRTLSGAKSRAIAQQSGGTLSLLGDSVDFSTDVAGMPALRLLLHDLTRIGERTVRVVLAGPPGTGKTYSAQAIAQRLGVPLVGLGRILGELLGQAENNMRRALDVLRAMAPAALFIDEADQGPLGVRKSGGQTSSEAYLALRSMLFEFLSDPGSDDGISVIATTNVPSRLDPAALSRFSILPVLFASGTELAEIMAIAARKAGITLADDVAPAIEAFTSAGSVLSGRSVQKVLRRARVLAARAGNDSVGGDHVAQALASRITEDWTPASEYSTLTSLLTCDDADALPWRAAELLSRAGEPGWDASIEVPTYLRPYVRAGDDVGTHLDADRAQERATQLEQAGVYA